MLRRSPPARTLIGAAVTLCFAGCVTLPTLLAPDDLPPLPAQPHVKPDAPPPAPELRIPADAVSKTNDIPVVPVPPIPLGQGAPLRTTVPPTQPEVRPVATLPPPPPRAPDPAAANPAAPPPAPAEQLKATEPADLKEVLRLAADAYGRIDSYTARLTRREQVNGKNKPEEVMLFRYRKEPWSVYFKWLGPQGQGREVVYVKGRHEDKIHTLLAAGDMPFAPAGKRMALAPDSILVKSACRHPITDAGIGANIDRLAGLFADAGRGDRRRGTLTDLGVQKRADYPAPLRLVRHDIPAGAEEDLPRGGKRLYGFDTENRLPILLVTTDDKGQEVEYYRYDRILMPGRLDDADFDPDKLWAPAATKTAQAKP